MTKFESGKSQNLMEIKRFFLLLKNPEPCTKKNFELFDLANYGKKRVIFAE
jgi:hypothetical protein